MPILGPNPPQPATPTAETAVSGQDLFDMANQRLLGYQNAVKAEALLSYLNEGKDEIWAILKNLQEEYFMQQTQSTDASQLNFFPQMATNQRQYTLPQDFREIWYIEVETPGFEQMIFTYKDINDNDFREARRAANVDSTLSPSVEYFYTIFGKDQLLIAQFPETAFTVTIFYTRNILDFQLDDPIAEILLPYSKKIADYAVKKAMLGLQDQEQFNVWRQEWRDDITMIASSASPRNQADPVFVKDFLG